MSNTQTVVGPNQPPTPCHYVAEWERGLDPWHPDAFTGIFVPSIFRASSPRLNGWNALDWYGNVIGWIPDGTPLAPPEVIGKK